MVRALNKNTIGMSSHIGVSFLRGPSRLILIIDFALREKQRIAKDVECCVARSRCEVGPRDDVGEGVTTQAERDRLRYIVDGRETPEQ